MAFFNQQNQQQAPFWDFIRSLDASAGVDHAPHNEDAWGPSMGGFPFGFGGPEGRRGRGRGGWGRGGWGGWGGPHAHGGPGGPHGGHGRHGGRGRRDEHRHDRSSSHEREGEDFHGETSHDDSHGSRSPSPDTLRERSHSPPLHFGPRDGPQGPPPPPHDGPGPHHGPHGRHHGPGPKHHGPGHHGPRRPGRGPRTHGHGHPHGHGPPPFGPHGHGPHGPHGRGHRGPPPPPYGAPFDMSALLGAFATHPFAQALRSFTEQAGFAPADARDGQANAEATEVTEDGVEKFTPPFDLFSTPVAYILHIALPGAKKEDVGVNWDAEKKILTVAGVVYRSGDEEFLKTLTFSERKVGMFEREVSLGEDGEVDGDEIKAKLEDGILVVTVGKVEKEWTEVKRIDIE